MQRVLRRVPRRRRPPDTFQTHKDPKLDQAAERYILTVFSTGCNLGSNQAARHMAGVGECG
jgi:hypothetical protein